MVFTMKVAVSLAMGLGVFLGGYKGAEHALLDTDSYVVPSTDWQKRLDMLVTECGIETGSVKFLLLAENGIRAEKVSIAGAHQENVILLNQAYFNVCGECESKSSLEEFSKNHLERSRQLTDLQNFIIKHELGHIRNHDCLKMVIGDSLIYSLSLYVFLSSLNARFIRTRRRFAPLLHFSVGLSVGAASVGAFCGINNCIFHQRAERSADLFAAMHSTSAQIKAGAKFFECKQREVGQPHFWDKVTHTHPDGYTRAAYLREFLHNSTLPGK